MAVEIHLPTHISARPPPSTECFQLQCHAEGVVWRGLAPILLKAPSQWTRRLLRLLFRSYTPSNTFNDDDDQRQPQPIESEEPTPRIKRRRLSYPTRRSRKESSRHLITIWIQPPQTTPPDYIFNSLVTRLEHQMLQTQTLSAWMSTLGGGYFFCKRLSKSLLLSQQQRQVALKLNNHDLAEQCQVNEIFNWLYMGKFQIAKSLIAKLEADSQSSTIHRQCQAARVLLHRLKKFQRKLHKYRTSEHGTVHAIDDYQRIRLVQE